MMIQYRSILSIILLLICLSFFCLSICGCNSTINAPEISATETNSSSHSITDMEISTTETDNNSSNSSIVDAASSQSSSDIYSDDVYDSMYRIGYYGEVDAGIETLSNIPDNEFALSISNSYNNLIKLCSSQIELDFAKGMLSATYHLSDICNFSQAEVLNVWIINYDEATVAEHSNDIIFEIEFRNTNSTHHGFVIIESFVSPEAIKGRFVATEKVEAHNAYAYIYGSSLDSAVNSIWEYHGINPDKLSGITKATENYEENSGLQYRKLSSNEFSNLNTIVNHEVYKQVCPYWEIFNEITNKRLEEQIKLEEQINQHKNSVVIPDRPEPCIGMTSEQVRESSWGSPLEINRTTYSFAVKEQWVYRRGYIYFEDGFVTAIQEKLK